MTKFEGMPVDDHALIKHEAGIVIAESDIEVIPPLSEDEREEHLRRTKEIAASFQDVAKASLSIWGHLGWINQHRTYREDYSTFQDYCKTEFGKDNSQIYRHIKDAEFKEELLLQAEDDTERLSIMALKESNTRFMRGLPKEVQIPIWKLALGMGNQILPKKEDGSIEMTSAFLESVGDHVGELQESGGMTLDGQFIPVGAIQNAAEMAGVTEQTAQAVLAYVGVAEDYLESIKRQEQHIKERSAKADFVVVKGTVETKVDVNGSEYPIVVDSKGNEVDLNELALSFNHRFVTVSFKAPIR